MFVKHLIHTLIICFVPSTLYQDFTLMMFLCRQVFSRSVLKKARSETKDEVSVSLVAAGGGGEIRMTHRDTLRSARQVRVQGVRSLPLKTLPMAQHAITLRNVRH